MYLSTLAHHTHPTTHIHTHTHPPAIHSHNHTLTHTHTHITPTHSHTHTHTHTYTHWHALTHPHTHTHTHTPPHTHIYTHTYTHSHALTHTYTHKHTHTHKWVVHLIMYSVISMWLGGQYREIAGSWLAYGQVQQGQYRTQNWMFLCCQGSFTSESLWYHLPPIHSTQTETNSWNQILCIPWWYSNTTYSNNSGKIQESKLLH